MGNGRKGPLKILYATDFDEAKLYAERPGSCLDALQRRHFTRTIAVQQHAHRDLAPSMGEVDVEGALDVGGVLGIHSDTDGVEPWREYCLHPGRHGVAEESQLLRG